MGLIDQNPEQLMLIPRVDWSVAWIMRLRGQIQGIIQGGTTGSVFSVFGRTGAVTAESGDYSAYYELLANKTTNFDTLNNTLYPTTQATYNLVQQAIAGLNPVDSVQAATTTALPDCEYENGSSGVGALLIADNNGALVIDGVTVSVGNRVLVKNQSTPAHNGIYVVDQAGSAGTPWTLERATDYDTPADINNSGAVPVISGTTNGTTSWLLISSVTTVGTDALLYSQFTLMPTLIALNTLGLSQFPTASTTSAQLATVISDETGTGVLVFATNPTLSGATFADATNIILNTSTGTKIGTATNQKLGFFNATPVVQQTGNIITALQTLGLVTSGSISASDMSALLSTANTWTTAQRGAFTTLSYSATTTIDMSLGNNFRILLTGNVTFNFTNLVAGQSGVINVWQDSTGSRTVAWQWMCAFAGGTAPVASTGKFQQDQFTYMVNRFQTSTVTMTIATPCVVTWTAHGLFSGQEIQFTTTGALPTGLAVNTSYWINVTGTDTFNVASSFANLQAGTYIATSGSQSGTHTATAASITVSLSNAGVL